MKKYLFKIRCAAIILIAAGYGWAGGHYIPAYSSLQAYIFQLIIMIAILIMGIRSLSVQTNEKHSISWSVTGLCIFSVFLLLVNILNIIHWGYNLANLVPVALLMTGNALWITTIERSTRHDAKDKYLSNSQYNIFS